MPNPRNVLKSLLSILIFELIKAAILFSCAGTLAWWQAWAYLASDIVLGVLGLTVFMNSRGLSLYGLELLRKLKKYGI